MGPVGAAILARRDVGAVRAGIAQLVEHNLAKVGVAGSSPVSRSLKESVAFIRLRTPCFASGRTRNQRRLATDRAYTDERITIKGSSDNWIPSVK